MITTTSDPIAGGADAAQRWSDVLVCLACKRELAPCLQRTGSLRCHDCRDAGAAIPAEVRQGRPIVTALRRLRLAA
jgi:hypothetical protein